MTVTAGTANPVTYIGPAVGEENTKPPAAPPVKLADNAGKEAYRTWRLQIKAWLQSCAEMRHIESAVRTAIIGSLGTDNQKNVTNFFSDQLGLVTVEQLIHYLDEVYQMLSATEEKRAVQEFRTMCKLF